MLKPAPDIPVVQITIIVEAVEFSCATDCEMAATASAPLFASGTLQPVEFVDVMDAQVSQH